MRRRSIFKVVVLLPTLGATVPEIALADPTGYGLENDRYLDRNPNLLTAVKDSESSYSRDEIQWALTAVRMSTQEPAAETRRGGLGDSISPMGTVCVTILRWQALAASYALDAGQAIGSIDVDLPGGVKWPSLFKLWNIAHYGTGKQLRAWINKQTWPKRACVSDYPA